MTAHPQCLTLDITTANDHPIHLDQVTRISGLDATGYFALAPGHADFVTALVPSVLAWTKIDGKQGYAALLNAILILENGRAFVTASEAYLGSGRDLLLTQVMQRRAEIQIEADRAAQKAAALDSAARRRLAGLSGQKI
jgi:F-type H+-transporting ATPase subunit epsilon